MKEEGDGVYGKYEEKRSIIPDIAEFNVVKDSYADTQLQEYKYRNQTIKFITE